MFKKPILAWYTDLLTVNRTVPYQEGNLTKKRRETIAEGIPCRVYRNSTPPTTMKETAAQVAYSDMLACDNSVDIKAGDELQVVRGGGLGYASAPIIYYAGDPTPYYEPFGGAVPDLAHQQIPLNNETRN